MGKVFGIVLALLLSSVCSLQAQVFNDCDIALGICGNDNLNFNVNGPGDLDFPGNRSGCLTDDAETQSVWLLVQIESGTNYAVYGPNLECGSLGNPVRCSYYGGNFTTGVGEVETTLTDVSEPAAGSGSVLGYTSIMTVTPKQWICNSMDWRCCFRLYCGVWCKTWSGSRSVRWRCCSIGCDNR